MSKRVTFTRVTAGRKLRIHQWFNTATDETLYGIQANVAYGLWAHLVGHSDTLLLYTDRDQAKAKIQALTDGGK